MPFRSLRLGLVRTVALMALGLCALGEVAMAADSTARAKATSGRPLIMFAAASLADVLPEVENAFTAKTGIEVKTSFAASSTLARQIASGARAEVFFCADEAWMDYLAQRNLLQAKTRHDVVGNQLVVIAPVSSNAKITVEPGGSLGQTLAEALGRNGRLATGDPDSVPVGKYAQAALTNLGAWNAIAPRLVRAENVRAALAYVARGEAPLGIVYSTDARAEKRVKVIATFPEDSHPPIRYPIAATTASTPAGIQFVEFARGDEARAIFGKYGFEPVH